MAQENIQISVPIIGTTANPVAYANQIKDGNTTQSDINTALLRDTADLKQDVEGLTTDIAGIEEEVDSKIDGVTFATTKNEASVILGQGASFRIEPGTGMKVDRASVGGTAIDGAVLSVDTDVIATKEEVEEVETQLENKANTTEVNAALLQKANNATTLAGYGITDAYTKDELNNLITTPNQKYVTVATFASLPATGEADTIYRVSSYDGTQTDATKYAEYAWNGTDYILLSVKSAVDEVFDISAYNSNAKYADLAAALGTNGANVPVGVRKGGMSVKFIKNIPATYSVVKSTSDTQPTGTALDAASSVESGIYNAEALTDFSVLPMTVSSAASVYYFEDSGTYTIWTITMATAASGEYVQYKLMSTAWSTVVTNWQGADEEPTAGSKNLVESAGAFNKFMSINGNINIKKVSQGSYVGSWSLEGNLLLLAGKTYNVFNTEDSAATSFNLFDKQGTQVYTNQGIAVNRTITITPQTDIFRISGYCSKPAINIIITENNNMLDVLNAAINNINDIDDRIGSYIDIEYNAESGSYVGSWSLNEKFKAGVYKIDNNIHSYTSLIFYDENNNVIYRNENLARNAITTITLSQDAVRVGGYSSNTQYGIVKMLIVAGAVNEALLTLERSLNEINSSIDEIKENIWNINGASAHIYKVPQEGGQVGSWVLEQRFKSGTYLIKNANNSYGSINFYAEDGSIIYKVESVPRDTTFKVTLSQDAVRVGGYNSIVNSTTNIIIVGEDTIESRLETIEENKDICILNPPLQYDNLIYNNIRSKRIDNSLKKLFTLVHFSDIHGIVDNVTRLSKFVERYKSEIDDIICTGDIVADRYEDTNILNDYPNIIALIGNHDAWLRNYNAEIAERQDEDIWVAKQSYCYDKFIANSVANWGVTQPSDVETTKKCYYYKDYEQGTSKLRVICLDCMHFNIGDDIDNNNSIQNTWLSNVLTDAKNNSIPVVIAVHYWPVIVSLTNDEVIKCAYSNTDSIASDYLPSIAIQTVQSFIDNGGEFVCWIVGHAHCDLIVAPRDYQKQMFITVDCATYANSIGNSARVKNTKSQDCFNIITFDTYDKLIKVVRVGSDTTRQLKQKRVLAYRYAPITDGAGVLHNIGLEYCG